MYAIFLNWSISSQKMSSTFTWYINYLSAVNNKLYKQFSKTWWQFSQQIFWKYDPLVCIEDQVLLPDIPTIILFSQTKGEYALLVSLETGEQFTGMSSSNSFQWYVTCSSWIIKKHIAH